MKLSELINKYYDELNKNDVYICQYILSHKKECGELTIDELARRCNVSRTTILRFAKKLSLKGYSELKVYLKMENERAVSVKKNILEEACNVYHYAIDEFKEKDCTNICKMIYEADRIIVYGTGYMQVSVANDMKRKFMNVEKAFFCLEGTSEARRMLKMIDQKDLIIIISLSGENREAVQFAQDLRVRNIPLISLTKLKENMLSRLSRENIYVGTSEIRLTEESSFETALMFYMMTEILLLKYTEYKIEHNL